MAVKKSTRLDNGLKLPSLSRSWLTCASRGGIERDRGGARLGERGRSVCGVLVYMKCAVSFLENTRPFAACAQQARSMSTTIAFSTIMASHPILRWRFDRFILVAAITIQQGADKNENEEHPVEPLGNKICGIFSRWSCTST